MLCNTYGHFDIEIFVSARMRPLCAYDIANFAKENICDREANSHTSGQEIPRILWNPHVHYRVHRDQNYTIMIIK
jgi:hypothetical protein